MSMTIDRIIKNAEKSVKFGDFRCKGGCHKGLESYLQSMSASIGETPIEGELTRDRLIAKQLVFCLTLLLTNCKAFQIHLNGYCY